MSCLHKVPAHLDDLLLQLWDGSSWPVFQQLLHTSKHIFNWHHVRGIARNHLHFDFLLVKESRGEFGGVDSGAVVHQCDSCCFNNFKALLRAET